MPSFQIFLLILDVLEFYFNISSCELTYFILKVMYFGAFSVFFLLKNSFFNLDNPQLLFFQMWLFCHFLYSFFFLRLLLSICCSAPSVYMLCMIFPFVPLSFFLDKFPRTIFQFSDLFFNCIIMFMNLMYFIICYIYFKFSP